MADFGLIHGDALRIPLRDESVDVVISSPPYWALRSYQDDGEHYAGQIGSEPTPADFLAALWAVTDELWRVLKQTGSLWLNLGDKYAGSGGHNNSAISDKSTLVGNGHVGGGPKIKATRRSAPDRYNQSADVPVKSLMGLPWRYALGLICPDDYRHDDVANPVQWTLRAELIHEKLNGLPESVTDRVRRSHENWFHLTKQARYFAAIDEIRNPLAAKTLTHRGGGQAHGNGDNPDNNFGSDKPRVVDARGALPGSVWSVASEPLVVPPDIGVEHFASFSQEWPRRLILGWCPPGGVAFDPFVGTGTVPMVARALGRYGVGIDLSRDYLRLATWRIGQSRHGAKSIHRTNRERQGKLW